MDYVRKNNVSLQQVLVNKLMNLRSSMKDGEFLANVSDYRILLHSVSYERTSRKGHFYRYIDLEPFRVKMTDK
jgi:hypothetical protein